MKLNLGCGPDIKDGWINIDINPQFANNFVCQDITEPIQAPPADFILINHTLCTMNYENALEVLRNAHMTLKKRGKVQIIDMDLLKAFESYRNNINELPIKNGSDDYKLCMHISGYSTRLSLYTHRLLKEMLLSVGFSDIRTLDSSEYDTRPNESLIIEATK